VRREAQSGVCLLLGATALRLGLTDAALAYVKPSLRPLLVAAGVVLVVVGIAGLRGLRAERAAPADPQQDPHDADVHDHPAPWAAWLLVLPVVAVFLVAPAPLGSYAANRQSDSRAFERGPIDRQLPPEVDGAVPLKMRDFLLRAVNGDQLEQVTVRLTGFTTTDAKGVVLNRFRVTCCAADGIAMRVRLEGLPTRPADDSWYVVEGRLKPGVRGSDGTLAGLPVLQVERSRPTSPPSNQYEV
jgi:uncharacterized repeat protein (TIGR03943 family)